MKARIALGVVCLLAGCAGQLDGGGASGDGERKRASAGALPDGVYVNGTYHDLESDYLPHVVQCENGGAPVESLKAQAIAARTFLLASVAGQPTPHIGDGQQYQVFGCGVPPSGAVYSAVQATAGVYLSYHGRVANGQFVAGALTDGACNPTSDPTATERYVTRNQGRSGASVIPAPYPLASPSNPQNRGCMGQNLANCLASTSGYDALSILRYFYGADIGIEGSFAQQPAPAPAPSGGASTTATCDQLGYFGRCDGEVAEWAQDGQCKLRDCPAEGTSCGYISDTEGWGCLGVSPGGSTFDCASVGYAGSCHAGQLVWAENGACKVQDCAALGKSCGYRSDDVGYDCL